MTKVRAGTDKRHDGGSVNSASEIFIHPNYDNRTINVDIAVIKVCTFTEWLFEIAQELTGNFEMKGNISMHF